MGKDKGKGMGEGKGKGKGKGTTKHNSKMKKKSKPCLYISTTKRHNREVQHSRLRPDKMFSSLLSTPKASPPVYVGKRYSPIRTSPVKKHSTRKLYKNKNCSSKMSTTILKRILVHTQDPSLKQWYTEHIKWCNVCIKLKEIYQRRIYKCLPDASKGKNVGASVPKNDNAEDATPFIDFLKNLRENGSFHHITK